MTKPSVKKPAVSAAVKKAPRSTSAAAPTPLLSVVPLDDITRLLTDGFRANLDEIRELCETMKRPLVTVGKTEIVPIPTTAPPAATAAATDDIKPITLHDADRVTLETLFGGEPLSTAADITRLATRLSTVRLISPAGDACSLTIPLDTLERLEARRPVDTTLKEMIERGFSDYLEGLINGVF